MKQRAELQRETRRKIVEATVELLRTKGPAATITEISAYERTAARLAVGPTRSSVEMAGA